MKTSDRFPQALEDYIHFINKKYPARKIHELVSTRYALNHFERSILYRGVVIKEKADQRKSRLIAFEQLSHRTLHVDLFNILFTLAAYLRGYPVYIATDGLCRDASEGHDSHDWIEHLDRALVVFSDNLKSLNVQKIVLYLDNPLPLSGYLAREIEERNHAIKPEVEIIRHESPDHLISSAIDGIICTSDSIIIDRSSLPVFDLARKILEDRFAPKLIRLEAL